MYAYFSSSREERDILPVRVRVRVVRFGILRTSFTIDDAALAFDFIGGASGVRY